LGTLRDDVVQTDRGLGRAPKVRAGISTSSALVGIWVVVLTTFIIATLQLARDILFPIALAALLTFLLAPLVTYLERWIGRIGAILMVVVLIFAATGGAGWLLTRQMVDLATNLPEYQGNIQSKLRTFQAVIGPKLGRFSRVLDELRNDLAGARILGAGVSSDAGGAGNAASSGSNHAPPVAVEVVASTKADPVHLAQTILAPLLGPLGTSALVLLLVIFMLLKREDLRGRLIRLIGQGRISATTRAMDDAGTRVNRYLAMQLLLNLVYGAMIGLGLYFIGVPNALLWGALGTVLRFIPYIGPWIAASFPIALSLAVAPGWMMPVFTVGLFVGVELLSNNVLEPWLYGSRTGVAPVALIFAAVFWTWLWGPAGLVLATPMTVCLVVMGRHIPRLAFLGVVLSDKDALTPAEDCYYRLLTVGEQDEMELIEGYLREHSCAALFDAMLIPVISAVEIDHRLELLDEGQRGLVLQGLRDVVEDLEVGAAGALGKGGKALEAGLTPAMGSRVYCLPARADRDELASEMFSHLLRRAGCVVEGSPAGLGAVEMVRRVEAAAVDLVCISVMFPSTVLHARQLCLKLQALVPRPKVLVGLWGIMENGTDAARRVRESGADEVVSTFEEGLALAGKLSEAKAGASAVRIAG
jgi:predicted PurR-regulated permease PerM